MRNNRDIAENVRKKDSRPGLYVISLQTPLHLAVYVNQPDIVAALLMSGANPNLVDRSGRTAAHIAVARQFPPCLRAVIENSEQQLKLNARDYEGEIMH